MNPIIQQMLAQHTGAQRLSQEQILKEVIQEIILFGLSKTDFFTHAAFYGGTALRIFHNLNRFSEDMDFSLQHAESDFQFENYTNSIESVLHNFGMQIEANLKEKSIRSDIQSAFVKGNTRSTVLAIYGESIARTIARSDCLKIKVKIDTTPPDGAGFMRKVKLNPQPHFVTLYDEPSLFAGKLHAILCRSWKHRVKGRDLYDLVFYRSRNTPVNLAHLRNRLVDSGALQPQDPFTREILIEMLKTHFSTMNFESAKQDVFPFIARDSEEQLDLWGEDFFSQIVDDLQGVQTPR